jgi:hypothetical protein
MKKFVQDYLNGKLEPYIKSAPVPGQNLKNLSNLNRKQRWPRESSCWKNFQRDCDVRIKVS